MESRTKVKKRYFNLSEPQKMIFLGEQFYPETSLNTVCVTSDLANHDNIVILKEVIADVIRENPGLHLKIKVIEGIPYQYIENKHSDSFDILDFRGDVGESLEYEWLESELRRSYKFDGSDLYKFQLYYSFNNSLKLLISTHHIISDAWSHQSLAKQVYDRYELLSSNQTPIYESKLSYLDYVEDEINFLKSKRFEKSGEFWRSKYSGVEELPKSLKLKSDTFSGKSFRYRNDFSESIQKKIRRICDENSISYSSFFLASLLVTLTINNDSKKHFLGTLSYNRLGKREKEAVGMFVNTLPVLFDLEESLTFLDIVKVVDSEIAGIMRNQRYPLRCITNDPELKKLNISGNLDIIYSYQNIILPYDNICHFSYYSSYPILFRPSQSGGDGKFFLDIDYQSDLFSLGEIKKLSKTFERVVEHVELDTKFAVGEFLENYNCETTLHKLFEEKCDKYPDKRAVSFNDASLTYSQLNSRANQLALRLRSEGAGKDKPVVLVLDRSIEMMISILAILKSGSCYLPLSPEQPVNRLEKIINLSGSGIILFNNSAAEEINSSAVKIDLRTLLYSDELIPNVEYEVKPEDLCYIIYTSGSTGEPKGVMIEHRSVINRLLWMQYECGLDQDDIILQKTPYTFDVSVWELFGWYVGGSSLHFLVPGGEKEPNTISETIYKEKITIIHFVPSMLNLFLEFIDKVGSLEHIKSVRRFNCSGEALLPSHIKRFDSVIGISDRVELFNLYGPTEATVEVTLYRCNGEEEDFIPIGKPIKNSSIYILDEKGSPLPNGSPGELHIGGICLARGYFNRRDLTEDKFKNNNPTGERLYSSGDLAMYLDDGNIKYLGRIDNQVKIRGNRVELGEIETSLTAFPNIKDAAVIAPVDENGNAYLGAYFIADNEISHDELRHYLQNILPSYMIPSYFIGMDEFPLTSSGKLDRKKLPEPSRNLVSGSSFHAPVNDREEEICEIWEDVLKIENIGRDDNFFDLGGDSLALIRVHFALQDKYDVLLQDLFEFQTIETLAQHIKLRKKSGIYFDDDLYSDMLDRNRATESLREYYLDYQNSATPIRIVYNNILITGATGYLGAYIGRDLLENTNSRISLLIRGESLEVCEERIRQKFTFYFGEDFYNEYSDRISIVPGDISKENLGVIDYNGLVDKIDSVIHCAASVKHYGEREDLYKANLAGTKNIIKLCKSGAEKKLVFISTISVGLNYTGENFTEDIVCECYDSGNVYIDSKIRAEEAVRNSLKAQDYQILRVGNVVNDLKGNKFQENFDENGFYKLFKEYKKKGEAPDISISFMDLSMVNEVARAITILSFSDSSGCFHIFNPNRVTLREMCEPAGVDLKNPREFISRMVYGDPLLVHGYYLKDLSLLNVNNLNDKTNYILGKLGFEWSSINSEIINEIWESWEKLSALS